MYKTAADFIAAITARRASNSDRRNFLKLIEELGHPERQLKCLHVAGTNGKGSVTNYLRSILQCAGYKTGSFTSPHLRVHNDRIRINDVNIPDERLLELGNRLEPYIEKYNLSMFEIDMLLSIYYFLEEKCDYVVYEVGLGGRLDATNIINPLLCVITNIGYDHMEYLGHSLKAIAGEKAGIIKPGVPVFTGEYKKSCLEVFKEKAQLTGSELQIIKPAKGHLKNDRVSFRYEDYEITLSTRALYQAANASLALAAADYLRRENIIPLKKEDIVKGLETAIWCGRFEEVGTDPLVIIDGAHNEHGVRAIRESIKLLPKPLCIVVSILKDKQYDQMLRYLKPLCDELVITSFSFYRAASIEQLEHSVKATVINDWHEAIDYARKKYHDGTVLITGSLYFVSEVRALLKEEDK